LAHRDQRFLPALPAEHIRLLLSVLGYAGGQINGHLRSRLVSSHLSPDMYCFAAIMIGRTEGPSRRQNEENPVHGGMSR
jgi:hypothetical protein